MAKILDKVFSWQYFEPVLFTVIGVLLLLLFIVLFLSKKSKGKKQEESKKVELNALTQENIVDAFSPVPDSGTPVEAPAEEIPKEDPVEERPPMNMSMEETVVNNDIAPDFEIFKEKAVEEAPVFDSNPAIETPIPESEPTVAVDEPTPIVVADEPVPVVVADEPTPVAVTDEPSPVSTADEAIPQAVAVDPIPQVVADEPISPFVNDNENFENDLSDLVSPSVEAEFNKEEVPAEDVQEDPVEEPVEAPVEEPVEPEVTEEEEYSEVEVTEEKIREFRNSFADLASSISKELEEINKLQKGEASIEAPTPEISMPTNISVSSVTDVTEDSPLKPILEDKQEDSIVIHNDDDKENPLESEMPKIAIEEQVEEPIKSNVPDFSSIENETYEIKKD